MYYSNGKSNNHFQTNLSNDEQLILKIAIGEYKDLFNKILEIPKNNFISILEKYIQISLIPRNIILPSGTMKKILQIIQTEYYSPEYEKIHNLINSIDDISSCEKFTGNNFYPHCNNCKEAFHTCGKKMFILNNLEYILCLNCKKIYHPNLIELYCKKCNCNYFTGIDNKIDEKYKVATWSKYHCNAVMNDVMKCPNCKNILYLNLQNNNLFCKNCTIEFNQHSLFWTCLICNKEFTSEAKIYNPFEFRIMKIAVKETIFKGIEAKPEIVPCCNISKEDILQIKFIHKKECIGTLFEGELNKKKIVVCGKCHMLNFYEYHKWFCPICKERFCLKDFRKEINLQKRITRSARKVNNKSQFDEEISSLNQDDVNIRRVSSRKLSNYKSNNELNSSIGNVKQILIKNKLPNRTNSDINLISSNFINFRRDISPRNFKNNFIRDNSIYMSNDDCKKEISEFNLNEKENIKNKGFKKMYSQEINSMIQKNELLKENSISSNKKEKNLSGININLNLNFNIRNNNKNPIIKRYNTSNNNLTSSLNSLYIPDKKKFTSDDYNIISLIGEGTFGKIYQVSDENNKKYAMKKILANSIDEVNAIQSEYEMLLTLSKYNLNLVNIYGLETKKLDKTTFVIYVLMDLAIRDWEKEIILRGKKKQYYKESELIIILKQLVHTFAELQRHKISHRDIKPQNILLFLDNSFRIADFGEAKEMMTNNRATIKQTIRGTELYMSPILFHALQKKNISKYTEHNTFKSDVFSLGLCLLFAATLTFNSLCEIREIDDTILIKIALNKYLKRYSNKFTDILYLMLEVDEKYRDDFIELENRVEFL